MYAQTSKAMLHTKSVEIMIEWSRLLGIVIFHCVSPTKCTVALLEVSPPSFETNTTLKLIVERTALPLPG